MLINCVAYQDGKKLADIDVEQIRDYVDRPDCFVWVALRDATDAELSTMQARIQNQAKEEMSKTQRDYFLREQLKQIQQELGEGDERTEEINELKKQLASLRGEYQAAKMAKALQDARSAIQGFGEALKDTAKSVEDAFKNSQTNSDQRSTLFGLIGAILISTDNQCL